MEVEAIGIALELFLYIRFELPDDLLLVRQEVHATNVRVELHELGVSSQVFGGPPPEHDSHEKCLELPVAGVYPAETEHEVTQRISRNLRYAARCPHDTNIPAFTAEERLPSFHVHKRLRLYEKFDCFFIL